MTGLELSVILEAAVADPMLGPKRVYDAAQSALALAARRAGYRNLRKFLAAKSVRRKWTDAVKCTRGSHKIDADKLAECIRKLGISLHDLFEVVPPPWRGWRAGSPAVVFVGSRPAHPIGYAAAFARRSNSTYDTRAVMKLQSLLWRDLALDAPVELNVTDDQTPCDYDLLLNAHRRAGALIFLGSSRINPLTDCVADRLFRSIKGLEVKFLFSDPIPKNSYLCSRCKPEEEGIQVVLPGEPKRFLPRDHDSIVKKELAGMKGNRVTLSQRTFKDCGLLYVDFIGKIPSILAIGHSGLATECAIHVLADFSRLSAGLAAKGSIGENRLLLLFKVERRKLSFDDVDDFEGELTFV